MRTILYNFSKGNCKAGLLILVSIFIFTSCKKMIDAGPPKTQITETFKDLSGANSAMAGIYTSMEGYLDVNTSTLPGLSADELISYSSPISRYYTNSLNASINDDFWSKFYNCIFQANNLIEQVSGSTGIKEEDKGKLIAEATFLRAFLHFYLVNFYGDIPYITSTDYNQNLLVSRMSAKNIVYPLIIKDLLFAEANLTDEYPTGERVRANKAVATAMLARVYLYTADWQNAIKYATTVIDNNNYGLEELDNVFLKDSREPIFQFSPNVVSFPNAAEANRYILTSPPTQNRVSISDFLFNAFETGDLRQDKWIGTYTSGTKSFHYAYKYKNDLTGLGTEYSVVLRLAEQYLIRAEANAQLSNVPDAVADLNLLRDRANLTDLPETLSPLACLDHVMQERRVELFVEWGHRWLDLKRTGTVNNVMQTVTQDKGGVWKPEWQLYPIPQSQINSAVNFTKNQNAGYQ